LKNRKVILGGGESGVGASVLAKKNGFEVFLSDKAKINKKYKDVLLQYEINFEEGKHSEDKILNADEIIKSPGIPDNIPIIKKIIKKGIPIISEIEFAGRYTEATLICVTGSNGKTTTSLLIHHILKNAGLNVAIAGNIGLSFAMQVATCNFDYYVLEISSFQLDGMYDFKADVAVITNITPDHLDRYNNSFKNYIDSKFRILQNQTKKDCFVYCLDNKLLSREVMKRKINAKSYPFSINKCLETDGAFLKKIGKGRIKKSEFIIRTNSKTMNITLENLALQGKHNLYNSMAAGIVSRTFEIRKETIKESLSNFTNVEHRLEYVASIHGIEFINDSKATNVNSVWYALETSDKPGKHIIWIAGGIDKGNDYEMLRPLVKEKVKAIVCLGLDNKKIRSAFADDVNSIIETISMSEAVEIALSFGLQNDVVLLSPACASFDLFENYEDRGWQFKNEVRKL